MRLIFISAGPYPDGGAATNRHLAYAKGLLELGHTIEFLLLKTQKWLEKELVYQGIKFIQVQQAKQVEYSKIEKLWMYYHSIESAKRFLSTAKPSESETAVILLGTSFTTLFPLLQHSKALGYKVFHERTEYPLVVKNKSMFRKLDFYFYSKFILARFDGIYVINNELKKYFLELTQGKVEICVVNMIVDPSRFENIKKASVQSNKTITYCGSIEGEKDGVPILIESFSRIAEKFPKVKLQLINSSLNFIARQHLISKLNKLGIEEKVTIVGPLKRNDIPRFLIDSDILALARPDNMQAKGGFPTKLGEYLATGNPVVVTNVGEIGLFLKDGINAFVSEPGSVEKFAQKLDDALTVNNAYEIGTEGKKLVYNEFNYLVQSRILEEMFKRTNRN